MTLKQTISVLSAAFILVGCGAGPQPIATDEINKATDANKKVRAIFDAAGGDFDKVSEADKKFLIERFSTEKKAREGFELIKHPPGGMPGGPDTNQPR